LYKYRGNDKQRGEVWKNRKKIDRGEKFLGGQYREKRNER
jgi:hypothetical protein